MSDNQDLNIIESSFVDYWKSLDFSKWNESDVREDFIAPLLKILGYAKDTVNEIIREKTLNLSESYHRIGRKQVAIDYLPTIRLQKFWIIEAKPGNLKEMNFGDFLQAHLYAIHPEIQAKYIVLSNGWEVRVYDSLYSKQWDDYIQICTIADCHETFNELKTILGAKQITKTIRKHILSSLRTSLLVELNENEVNELKRDFDKIYYESLPIIRKNARDYQIEEWKKREKKNNETISSMSFESLCYLMDIPTSTAPNVGWHMVDKLKQADKETRKSMLAKLAMKWRERPHAIFRVQCINVLIGLIEEDVEIEGTDGYIKSINDGLEELINSNMAYWAFGNIGNKIEHIGFALSHLDNTCARFADKICKRIAMDSLNELVDSKRQTLSIEDLLSQTPTVAKEMVDLVERVYNYLWFQFNGGESREIWEVIWHLEHIEENIIDKIPQPQYPNNDFDLYNFGHYGKNYDMLSSGTWDILNSRRKKLEGKELPRIVHEIINKTREQIIDEIPKPIKKPDNWKPTNDSIMKIFSSIKI